MILGDAMGTTRASSIGRRQLVSRDLSGPGVDLGERPEVVGHRVGDPDIPVVIDDRVVHPAASVHARGYAGRPLAAIEIRPLVLELGDRDVVLGHYMARRVTGRARLELECQRGRLRPSCLSQVFGQLVLVVLDRERRPAVRPTPAVVGHLGHQVDDRPPATLIESVLQHQAGLVAFRAGDPKHLFESAILACVGRQGIQPLGAGQLVGEVGDGVEGEVLRRRLREGQRHFDASPFVTDRLRPHLVRPSSNGGASGGKKYWPCSSVKTDVVTVLPSARAETATPSIGSPVTAVTVPDNGEPAFSAACATIASADAAAGVGPATR